LEDSVPPFVECSGKKGKKRLPCKKRKKKHGEVIKRQKVTSVTNRRSVRFRKKRGDDVTKPHQAEHWGPEIYVKKKKGTLFGREEG